MAAEGGRCRWPAKAAGARREPQPNHLATRPGCTVSAIVGRHLGPVLLRIHRVLLAVDDVVVDAVLDVGTAVGHAEDPLRVGFVLGEQQRHVALAIEVALAQLGMRRP